MYLLHLHFNFIRYARGAVCLFFRRCRRRRFDPLGTPVLHGLGEGDEEEATTAGPSPGMLAEGLGIRSAPPSAQLVLELPSKARAPLEPEPAAFVDDEVSIVFDEPTFEPPDALELIAALGSSPRAAAPIPQSAPASLSVAPAAPADPANQAAVLQLRKSLVEAHQELQRMRPQLTELGRLRTELAEVRRELAETRDTAVVAASRELAGLRDELQKREHSLLDLREETSAGAPRFSRPARHPHARTWYRASKELLTRAADRRDHRASRCRFG